MPGGLFLMDIKLFGYNAIWHMATVYEKSVKTRVYTFNQPKNFFFLILTLYLLGRQLSGALR